MPRITYYGRQDQIESQAYFEWRAQERARMRLVMRERRARLRADRQGEPDYPEVVLASMARWIESHRDRAVASLLVDVVTAMRRLAMAESLADYDTIQDRGTAKLLRAMGFKLFRSGPGMKVIGLRVHPPLKRLALSAKT